MGWRITLEWSSKGGGETFGFKNSTRRKNSGHQGLFHKSGHRVSSAYEHNEEFMYTDADRTLLRVNNASFLVYSACLRQADFLTCYNVAVAVLGAVLFLLGHIPGGRLALKEALNQQKVRKRDYRSAFLLYFNRHLAKS